MMIKELSHASAILSMVASFLERWNISTYQRESIQVFYLLLKVWNFLTLGQVFCITHHEILSVLLWKKYLLGRGLVHATGVHKRNTVHMHKFALQRKAWFWCNSTG